MTLADGSQVPIASLSVGDLVLAWDEASGENGSFPITAVWVHDDAVTGFVVIDGEAVATTPSHPFYTLERGWVEAGDLVLGEHVQSATFGAGLVSGATWSRGPDRMYDLTVALAHTFFVGEGGWLVHNTGPCRLDPHDIKFSQDSIGRRFRDGRSVRDTARTLRNGGPDTPPIRILRTKGGPVTLDNRRLWAYRQAGRPVPTVRATITDIRDAIRRGKFSAGRHGSPTIAMRQ